MDPATGPTFWNTEHYQEFKLDLPRPPRVSRTKMTEAPEVLEKLHVRAGKEHWLEYNLDKGDALKFHLTGNANFGFAIVREETEQKNNVLAMPQIYPFFAFVPGPYTAPIDDTVIVSEPGVYKIWLSNARAWWSTLAIHHSIQVIKNQESY